MSAPQSSMYRIASMFAGYPALVRGFVLAAFVVMLWPSAPLLAQQASAARSLADARNEAKETCPCCDYRTVSCSAGEQPVKSDLAACGKGITPDPNLVRFVVIGDFGYSKYQCEGVVSKMVQDWRKRRSVDFVITVGDDNYNSGKKSTIKRNIADHYGNFVREKKLFPTLGNHDWGTTRKDPQYAWGTPYPYLDYFDYLKQYSPNTQPAVQGRYYNVAPSPLVELFGLDSDYHEQDGTCCNSKQAGWLRDALAASKAPWKLVYFHHPPYTTAREDAPGAWMRWPFKQWCATSVLSGHEHAYERLEIEGMPYFVNGLGGNPYLYDQKSCPVQPGSQKRYNGAHGAMLVVANSREMEFCFYSVKQSAPIDVYRQQVPQGCEPAPSTCQPSPDVASYCAVQPPTSEPDEPPCPTDWPGPASGRTAASYCPVPLTRSRGHGNDD